MFKKVAGVGLSLAFAGSLIAGCGSNGSTGKQDYVPKELNVQFVPSQNNAADLQAKTKPLEQLLQKELGIPVHVTVSTTYTSIVEAMASKQVDVGFIPATGYIEAHDVKHAADIILQAERYGVTQPGGKTSDKLVSSYRAEILVRKDSGITDPSQLKGKTMAWQDPSSPAGYVWPAVELHDKYGIDPQKDLKGLTFQGHGPAMMAVLNGQADACAVFEDARSILTSTVPDIFDKLTPIYFTQPIPNDTICVRTDMSPEWRTKIQNAFINIADKNKNPQGHEIISSIYTHEGYVKADDKSFDPARDYQKKLDAILNNKK